MEIAVIKDLWGDPIHVDVEHNGIKSQHVVEVTLWEGDAHVSADLDRVGVRKLRKALKRAAEQLPE